jgi:uncharacterized protein (DUF302 family)
MIRFTASSSRLKNNLFSGIECGHCIHSSSPHNALNIIVIDKTRRNRMWKIPILIILLLPIAVPVLADVGVITVKSEYSVEETANRLDSILRSKGMTVVARMNHAEAAMKVGMTLRPTELLIFGNPKVGTPLMLCEQRVALDLPQKALIWEDASGAVWISYNDPRYLAERHGIDECEEILAKIDSALRTFTAAAARP